MRHTLLSILKGQLSRDTWIWVLFITILGFIIIYSSHSIDKKAYQISELNKQVKELKGKYIEIHSQLMNVKKQSNVEKKVKSIGLIIPTYPPKKITIIDD